MEIANLSLNDIDEENTQSVQSIHPIQHNFYTGSSCMNVGSSNTRAAICICFDENCTDTVTELLDDSLSTNQKAELHAVYRALLCITSEININIISRSEYAVKSINVWSNKWRQNNWKNIPSGTSDNKSIVRSITEIVEDLTSNGKVINILHYNSVPNKQGNNIAHNTARDSLLQST